MRLTLISLVAGYLVKLVSTLEELDADEDCVEIIARLKIID